jgi:Serine dehydrogenase proteinase
MAKEEQARTILPRKPTKKRSKKAKPKQETQPKKYFRASACTEPLMLLPPPFVKCIDALKSELKMPVWLMLHGDEQRDEHPFGTIGWSSFEVFRALKNDLPNEPIALVIDSPGGDADFAYQTAMTIRRKCKKFVAVVPRWAKSAATLLCLGADTIYLGEEGQLGPLDAQVFDPDKEERFTSALDDVGSIEELEERAISAAVASMHFVRQRTGKKLGTLMPVVFDFVAKLHQPLFDKIDSVKFSRLSRVLSIAEKYATLLLQPRFDAVEAAFIAKDLVKQYPSHGFVIDNEQAKGIGRRPRGRPVGLQVAQKPSKSNGFAKEGTGVMTPAISQILDDLHSQVGQDFKAVGRIEEIKA